MDELERILEELRAGGRQDSEGRFTVDIARALEKMQRFQLPDVRLYPVPLVAGAVAFGAASVELELTPGEFGIRWVGAPLTREDVLQLLDPFSPTSQPALRNLAAGLAAARSLELATLTVESSAVRMSLGERHLTLEPIERPDAPNRIHLREKSQIMNVLGRLVKPGPSREEKHLRGRCAYGFAPVRLNGQPITRPFRFPHCYGAVWLKGPRGTELPVEFPELESELRERRSPGDYSAWVALVEPPLLGPMVTVVQDGVTYEPYVSLGYPAARAVIHAQGLARELSMLEIVQNEDFLVLLEQVRSELDRLALQLVDNPLVSEALVKRLRDRIGGVDPSGRPASLGPWTQLAVGFWDIPFVELADGSRASPSRVLPGYVERGYLATVNQHLSSAEAPLFPEDGGLIAYRPGGPRSDLLDLMFPVQASLHRSREGLHLQGDYGRIRRLPPGDYLIRRLVLAGVNGEIGLLAEAEAPTRIRLENEPFEVPASELPSGLLLTSRLEPNEGSVRLVTRTMLRMLPELYEALAWRFERGLNVPEPFLEAVAWVVRLWRERGDGGVPRDLLPELHLELLERVPFLPDRGRLKDYARLPEESRARVQVFMEGR